MRKLGLSLLLLASVSASAESDKANECLMEGIFIDVLAMERFEGGKSLGELYAKYQPKSRGVIMNFFKGVPEYTSSIYQENAVREYKNKRFIECVEGK